MNLHWTAVFTLVTFFSSVMRGQNTDETTRQVFAEEFLNMRPADYSTSLQKNAGTAPRPRFADAVTQLGITMWLLRPAGAVDGGVRMLVHENGQDTEWVPQRISAGTPLRQGDRVRLSFESARTGYLYVIDQEAYEGGKLGDPSLIFPTTRLRHGQNRVMPGRLIEVPGQEDRPNFLTVRKSRPEQGGEVLSIIIASRPLAGVHIGPQPIPLSVESLTAWQKEWGAKTEIVDLKSRAGKTWTRAEQEAGASETRLLTQEDPGPQTIYRVSRPADEPLFVTVELRYASPRSAR